MNCNREILFSAVKIFTYMDKLTWEVDNFQDGYLIFKKLLSQNVSDLKTLGLNKSNIELCQYALIALIDEMMVRLYPQEFSMSDTLQMSYFGEHRAGEKFYENLELLNHNIEESAEILLLYHYCLLAGFQGMYPGTDNPKRKLIIENIDYAFNMVSYKELPLGQHNLHVEVESNTPQPNASNLIRKTLLGILCLLMLLIALNIVCEAFRDYLINHLRALIMF